MEKKKQGVRRSVGAVSELAGVFVGSATSAGRKIIAGGGRGIAGIRRSIFSIGRKGTARTAGKTTKAPELSEVKESEVSPPESEFFSLESVPQHNADTETRAKELEFELADAQRELNSARHKAEEAQSHLTSQLSILQRETMSPLFNPENIESRRLFSRSSDSAPRHNTDTEVRTRKLESELAEEQEARSDLMAQLEIMQKERMSIAEELNDARDEAADARDRILDIESKLDEVQASQETSEFSQVTPEDVHNALFSIESEREIVQRSLSDITDRNEETRSEAAEALGSVHHELAVRVLADRLPHEPSARVRVECVGALTTLGMKEGLPAVERALTDETACVRLAAVKGVYRLAGARSAPMLMSALSDENDSVRYRAGVLTGWLGRNDMAAKMRKLLENQNPLQGFANEAGRQAEERMEDTL